MTYRPCLLSGVLALGCVLTATLDQFVAPSALPLGLLLWPAALFCLVCCVLGQVGSTKVRRWVDRNF